MRRKLVILCVLALVTFPVLTATANEVEALDGGLNAPTITGPKEGRMGQTYEYKITYTDPDGDDVYYRMYWGDCTVIFHDGPHKSGEEIKFSHSWCEICCGPGKFTIHVQASDDEGQISNWGTLDVTMKSNRDRTSHSSFLIFLFERFTGRFQFFENLLNL